MNCPKCVHSELAPKESGGLRLDECPDCGGCWYDADELRRALKDPSKLQAATSGAALRPRPTSRLCPRCHASLVNGGLGHELLRADFCGKCSGLWLDRGELRVIEKILAW